MTTIIAWHTASFNLREESFLGWREILLEIIFPQQQRKGESLRKREKEKRRKIRSKRLANVIKY